MSRPDSSKLVEVAGVSQCVNEWKKNAQTHDWVWNDHLNCWYCSRCKLRNLVYIIDSEGLPPTHPYSCDEWLVKEVHEE